MQNIQSFTKQFIKDKKMVGSIIPSWRYLVNKIIKQIDFKKDNVIVEFGPGTGAFTFKLIKKLEENSKLFVFELNEAFYNNLKSKISDPRVILINDSAEKIGKYLAIHNLSKADVIISSLPLTNLSEEIRLSIVNNAYTSLKQKGKFIQYQYSSTAKELLMNTYKEVKILYIIINMPPAIIYVCEK